MAVANLQLLRDALAKVGESGELDAASTLLTVDKDGYPFVCLLTSRQLAVHATQLVALVQSRRTLANLEGSGRATLHLVHDGASVTANLELRSSRTNHERTLLYFDVASLEAERRSTILTPIMYHLDDHILAREGADIHETLEEP